MAEGEKKTPKIIYWIAGIAVAALATIGIMSFVKYKKSKKQQEDSNFLLGIINTLKEKGIVFGKDDSLLLKVLKKLSDEDLSKIITLLKKDKLTTEDKAVIFTILAKILTPESTVTVTKEFAADGKKQDEIINHNAIVKAADGSKRSNLYKLKNNSMEVCKRIIHDNNKISVKQVKKIGDITYYNIFNEIWINSADVQLIKE